MGNVNNETTNSSSNIERASNNVTGAVRKLWLEKSIAEDIVSSFQSEEYAEGKEFGYDEIYQTLRKLWYFEATKKQIFSLANHEMTAKEVKVLDEIILSYASKKKETGEK